jgi:hypothetical protein
MWKLWESFSIRVKKPKNTFICLYLDIFEAGPPTGSKMSPVFQGATSDSGPIYLREAWYFWRQRTISHNPLISCTSSMASKWKTYFDFFGIHTSLHNTLIFYEHAWQLIVLNYIAPWWKWLKWDNFWSKELQLIFTFSQITHHH